MAQDNSAQIEFWDGQAGDTWAAAQEQMDDMLAPLSQIALAAADVQPGERVIDIGCGCGATSLALADAGASVWGVDLSAAMLARAKHRAAGREQLAFMQTDAAAQRYTPDHDLIFSRFGVMFFAEPIAAFANLRTALNERGRLVFVCWQSPRNNPWMSVPAAAVQAFLSGPPDVPDPRAPGPFAFADRDWVQQVLESAGFHGIDIREGNAQLRLGADLDEVIRFQTQIGPMARMLAELADDQRAAAVAATREALTPFIGDSGVCLNAATWIVTAHR